MRLPFSTQLSRSRPGTRTWDSRLGVRVTSILEAELGCEPESAPWAAIRQRYSVRLVGHPPAVHFFEIGEVLRADRRTDSDDRHVRSFWQTRDERDVDVDAPTERRGGRRQKAAAHDLWV